MLKPSYAELMDVMNKDNETGDSIKSRYTVVIAAAKRARQIIEGDKPMVDDPALSDKPLSVAVEELEKGKIKVVPEGMGTVIHIEKDSLEEEIKTELKHAAEENAKVKNDIDEDILESDFDIEQPIGSDNLNEADVSDFSDSSDIETND